LNSQPTTYLASGFEAGKQMSIVKIRRILLIENENAIREVAQLCLETVAGWEVLTADSVSEGIVKAETKQVNAILLDLDVMTSDMDWPSIFQKLQNNPATQHIPVILLTATMQSKDLPQFPKLGVAAVIVKPFDLLTLAGQVAATLDWKT
jgi:CheY-like chemotaxis protein